MGHPAAVTLAATLLTRDRPRALHSPSVHAACISSQQTSSNKNMTGRVCELLGKNSANPDLNLRQARELYIIVGARKPIAAFMCIQLKNLTPVIHDLSE
jgi:hypothetical protein